MRGGSPKLSHAQVESRREQIAIAQDGVAAAEESLRLSGERIGDGQGLPIEMLPPIQTLDLTRRQYVRTVAEYNRAQFQLQRALGCPVR